MKRLLIVAGDPDLRAFMSTCLEHLGYMVDEAADLTTAFIKLQSVPPAAVLLFTHPRYLPAGRFLDRYDRQHGAPTVPVALIAPDARGEDEDRSGVQQVLRMPFSLDELAYTVRSLVGAVEDT